MMQEGEQKERLEVTEPKGPPVITRESEEKESREEEDEREIEEGEIEKRELEEGEVKKDEIEEDEIQSNKEEVDHEEMLEESEGQPRQQKKGVSPDLTEVQGKLEKIAWERQEEAERLSQAARGLTEELRQHLRDTKE